MAKASSYKRDSFVKLLFIGNSGAGKTGALASLVQAGYKIRMIDLDNGLTSLIHHVSEIDPKLLDSIEYESYRDDVKMSPTGPRVAGAPKAYVNTLKALEKWPEDGSDPAEWGSDVVFVLDSLTNLGRAAFQWAKNANPTAKDPRQWYAAAQALVEDLIANLTSPSFHCHVLVISHIDLVETADGRIKGFASSIGKAAGPKLPRFFDTMILSETKGSGKNLKRTLQTQPTALIDLKNPAPKTVSAEYDISDGLAKIFEGLRA